MRETDRQEPEEEERTSLAILRVLPLRAPIIQSEFVAQASKQRPIMPVRKKSPPEFVHRKRANAGFF